MRSWVMLLLAMFLAGCSPVAGPLAPPPQGTLLRPVRFDRIGHFASMNRPNAEMYFVRDISPTLNFGLWRWTGRKPTLRFRLPVIEDLAFVMDFALPEAAMHETGPQTVTFRINGRDLATEHYDTPGQQHFRRPVPAAWLSVDDDTIASAEVDKVWHTTIEERKADLGFVLLRAGFAQ